MTRARASRARERGLRAHARAAFGARVGATGAAARDEAAPAARRSTARRAPNAALRAQRRRARRRATDSAPHRRPAAAAAAADRRRTPEPTLEPEERARRLDGARRDGAGLHALRPPREAHANRVRARHRAARGSCFVGEGPGADEDAQGFPFVGKAGQLLDRMIAAMGFSRDEVYVCNIVKCRPPDNRKPEPDEMAACMPYLAEQLELVAPRGDRRARRDRRAGAASGPARASRACAGAGGSTRAASR